MRRAGTRADASRVLARRADIGIALDGDADRLIMADEHASFSTATS